MPQCVQNTYKNDLKMAANGQVRATYHWGEPHDGCSSNHRQHGRGEESAAKCFRFVTLV